MGSPLLRTLLRLRPSPNSVRLFTFSALPVVSTTLNKSALYSRPSGACGERRALLPCKCPVQFVQFNRREAHDSPLSSGDVGESTPISLLALCKEWFHMCVVFTS